MLRMQGPAAGPHFQAELGVGVIMVRDWGSGSCEAPLISASACSSQNRMSISRYIVVAVVRCSRACSRLPVRR